MINEIIKLIESEIKWCKKHSDWDNAIVVKNEYQRGFINGLRQAITLIEKYEDCKEPPGQKNYYKL